MKKFKLYFHGIRKNNNQMGRPCDIIEYEDDFIIVDGIRYFLHDFKRIVISPIHND